MVAIEQALPLLLGSALTLSPAHEVAESIGTLAEKSVAGAIHCWRARVEAVRTDTLATINEGREGEEEGCEGTQC